MSAIFLNSFHWDIQVYLFYELFDSVGEPTSLTHRVYTLCIVLISSRIPWKILCYVNIRLCMFFKKYVRCIHHHCMYTTVTHGIPSTESILSQCPWKVWILDIFIYLCIYSGIFLLLQGIKKFFHVDHTGTCYVTNIYTHLSKLFRCLVSWLSLDLLHTADKICNFLLNFLLPERNVNISTPPHRTWCRGTWWYQLLREALGIILWVFCQSAAHNNKFPEENFQTHTFSFSQCGVPSSMFCIYAKFSHPHVKGFIHCNQWWNFLLQLNHFSSIFLPWMTGDIVCLFTSWSLPASTSANFLYPLFSCVSNNITPSCRILHHRRSYFHIC